MLSLTQRIICVGIVHNSPCNVWPSCCSFLQRWDLLCTLKPNTFQICSFLQHCKNWMAMVVPLHLAVSIKTNLNSQTARAKDEARWVQPKTYLIHQPMVTIVGISLTVNSMQHLVRSVFILFYCVCIIILSHLAEVLGRQFLNILC